MNANTWLDGRPSALFTGAELAHLQRAFSYGDGVFETIAVVAGQPRLFSFHLDRLRLGCQRLSIVLDEQQLHAEINRVLADSGEGILRVIVARAGFERGYRVRAGSASHRLLQFFQQPVATVFANAPDAVLHLCRQRLGRQPALAGLKHLNRLEQILARREWNDVSVTDGLMLDTQSNVIETVVGNVFIVRDRQIMTPLLDQCGVAGVMRRVVMEYLQTEVQEARLTLDDMYAAQEVFITSSTRGIQAVVQMGCLHWARGELTAALQHQLDRYLAQTSH